MLIYRFAKSVDFSVRRLSISVGNNAIQKQRDFIDSDRRERDLMPSFLRSVIDKKMAEPFSEVTESSWFITILKSLELTPDGPPNRIAWNKDSFTLENFLRNVKLRKQQYDKFQQRYIPERYSQLGNEIGTAHFIVFRGGGVKFYGVDKWVKMGKGDDVDDYDKNLPKLFNPNVFIECIDATDIQLYYEGLDNLHHLSNLKWLSLRNNKKLTDWGMDKIANEFCDTLEYLDLSSCESISYRGLSALCKMRKLSTLVVENIANSNEFQLSCVMLQEAMPNLEIKGVTYLNLKSKPVTDDNTAIKDSVTG